MLFTIPIIYLAFAIGFVAADRDCCYWFATGPNTQQFQVSWQSSTQTPSCSYVTSGGQWTSDCTATLAFIDNQYLAVNAIMQASGGPQFNMSFGMNNNACKYLHDDQVAVTLAPVGWGGSISDWSNRGTWNVNRDSVCGGSIIG